MALQEQFVDHDQSSCQDKTNIKSDRYVLCMCYFQDHDNDQDLKAKTISMTKRLNQDHCTELAKDDVTTKHTTPSTATEKVEELI